METIAIYVILGMLWIMSGFFSVFLMLFSDLKLKELGIKRKNFWVLDKDIFASIFIPVIFGPGSLFYVFFVLFDMICEIKYAQLISSPKKLPDYIIYQTMYVFSHEGDIAEMISVEQLITQKGKKGEKYFIPESCGRLELKKTYNFYKDEDGKFQVKQVAVFISDDVTFT